MSETGASQVSHGGSEPYEPPLPEYVDWVVAFVIALGGLIMTVGGTILAFVIDRDLLEEGIESGRITVVFVERELSRAEMLSFVSDVVDWTGWGLLLPGITMVLFAIVYVFVRHRAHTRTAAGESAGTFWSYAILGATASSVLSFVPFSPSLGGGIAGYLGKRDTGQPTSVGATSGFLYVLPGLVILAFVAFGLFIGLAGVGESSLGFVIIPLILLVFVFVTAYGVAVGALGGFVGGRFAANGQD